MPRNMHKYEELTPYEFDREKERASIIYVAAGPMEFHEECNALGIDPCKGYQWCLEAAEITGGIVFPMLPIAPEGFKVYLSREELKARYGEPHFTDEYARLPGLYPSMYFGKEVCRALYMELLEMFAIELQFKLCVFVGSHGPASHMIKDIVMEETPGDFSNYNGGWERLSGDFHGMQVMAIGSLDYNLDRIKEFYAEQDLKRVSHGGLWETALNYAVNPEYVQLDQLDESKYPQHYGALKEEFFEGCLRPVKSEYQKLSPELAKELHDLTVQRFAADVLEHYKAVK